jgi:hypothetical protein
LYLSAPGKKEGDDSDARVLTRKKANYARRDETIELRWANGVLVPTGYAADSGRPSMEMVFLLLLDKTREEGQRVSANIHSGNYAPTIFALRPERWDYRRADFQKAMQQLLSTGEIKIEPYTGSGRNVHEQLVRGDEAPF